MRLMTISGNLGRDAELSQLKSGTSVARFSVAVRQSRKNEQGNYDTDWIDCVVFGNRASIVEQYFKRGSRVVVSGEWSLDTYTTRDGETRTSLQLNVHDFDLPERTASNGQQSQSKQKNAPTGKPYDSIDISDDALPF